MSSIKIDKNKKKLEIENKKPPKKMVKEDSEQKKQNKNIEKERKKEKREKTIKISKEKEKEKLSEKIITNEPIEKEMLKGQEHKEEDNNKEEKNINELNISINNNIIEIPNINSPRNDKDTIEIKPRESYLKEKIMKMNYSAELFTSINKSLDNQVKSINNEYLDNRILITTITKKNNKRAYLPESLSSGDLPTLKDFESKSKLKTIKELKNEEEIIQI